MRNAWWCLLGVLAANAAAAQESQVSFAEPQPVALSGFAVVTGRADREAAQSDRLRLRERHLRLLSRRGIRRQDAQETPPCVAHAVPPKSRVVFEPTTCLRR